MRPNVKKIALFVTVGVASGAFAVEPSGAGAPQVQNPAATSLVAAPNGAQTAAAAEAARAEAIQSGAVGLAPAAVPTPRLVRSASAQARTGLDRPDEALEDSSTDSPEIAAEVDAESAELEDLRSAEESAHVADTQPTGPSQAGKIELLPELDMDLAALQAEFDIPIDVNPSVVAYVRFFQSPRVRPVFVKWLSRSHRYIPRYQEILTEEGVPKDLVYLAMIESGFGNFAFSRARASGPWQFIASTGRLYGLKQDFWVDERRDPERAARSAARFLKRLHDETGDWRLAWAGYNAGLGRINKAQRLGYATFWEMAAAPGRKALRAETKGYVPKLMAAAIVSKHPAAFGFKEEEIERQEWSDYAEVEIPSATLLSVIARASGTSEKLLIDLNPELRRSCTPPRSYKIKIPSASEAAFAEAWPALRAKVRTTFAGHVIRRGDTLSKIAREYGTPVQGIIELNGLKNGRKLRVGTELLIPRPMHAGPAVASSGEDEVPAASTQPARTAAAPTPAPAPAASPRVSHVRQAQPARTGRTVLRVRRGDTLWSISQKYGVEVADLCRWNGIKSPGRHKLIRGSRIVVYPERG